MSLLTTIPLPSTTAPSVACLRPGCGHPAEDHKFGSDECGCGDCPLLLTEEDCLDCLGVGEVEKFSYAVGMHVARCPGECVDGKVA